MKPGSCPPTVLPRAMVAWIFARCSGSARSRSAGLMSPPRHTASGRSRRASVASRSISWPDVSRWAGRAGTRPGTRRNRFRGRPAPSARNSSMPGWPRTLAISWASSHSDSTPRGTMARASSLRVRFELSMWTWGSMSPGATNCPSSSSSVLAERYPPGAATAAMRSPAITTSAGNSSRVATLTTTPPRSTRSAGSSPSATRTRPARSMGAPTSPSYSHPTTSCASRAPPRASVSGHSALSAGNVDTDQAEGRCASLARRLVRLCRGIPR